MTDHARSGERDWQSLDRGSAVGWLLAGIAVGAAAALLLAPSTGRELRHAIAGEFPDPLADVAAHLAGDFGD